MMEEYTGDLLALEARYMDSRALHLTVTRKNLEVFVLEKNLNYQTEY